MQITIEKLVYGGDGLARVPAVGDERRGKTIFLPYVLPGEVVEAEVVEERKGFSRAELRQVITPSEARVAPPCPHFGRCGGCQYQHADYAGQVEWKKEILREAVLRGAKLELPEITAHASEQYGYRNRIRMKVAHEPEFALGYHRGESHELEAVRECPIASPLIGRAIAAVWEHAPKDAATAALREVQFFANHDDSELLVELRVVEVSPASLAALADALRKAMPETIGVTVFAGGELRGELEDGGVDESLRQPSGEPHTAGAASLMCKVGDFAYRVSAGSFFQTNRFLAAKLVELVTAGREGGAALDLYAGVGLFTLPLAKEFQRVTAVELAPSSSIDLAANAAKPHIRTFSVSTESYLKTARGRWDYAVVDPPRAGLGEAVARSLAALKIPRICYVSCDPATLSRDLVQLAAAGYRVEAAHLVDLFPQSYHLETVLQLVR